MRLAAGLALGLALAVAGCGTEDDLAQCLASSEQIIVLRQIAATGRTKEMLEWCLSERAFTHDYCKALYINANSVVRSCMQQRGYEFKDADSGYGHCGFELYGKATCYGQKWVLQATWILDGLARGK